MKRRFYCYNKDDQAVVEAYVGPNQPIYKMSLPMIEYWHKEVSYILDNEDWSDEDEEFEHYKEFTEEEFFAGDTPRLIAKWRKALPQLSNKQRRTNWLEPKKQMRY